MVTETEVNLLRARSRFFLAFLCLSFAMMLLLGYAGTAAANVPTILQIVNISQSSEGKIRLEITHSSPSSAHYVDLVEVQINGATQQFSLQPQITNPFTAELNLGGVQGTPDVRARAHCNLHGWSGWSQTIAVPEFPATVIMALTLLVAVLASAAIIGRECTRA